MVTALELLKIALGLVEKDKNDTYQNGLCYYLERARDKLWLSGACNDNTLNQNYYTILRLMREWPGSSGISHYPVPGYDNYDGSEAYLIKMHLWDKNHPYGQKRWKMVNWIKQQLENDIDG